MTRPAGAVTAFVKEIDAEHGRVRVEYRGMQQSLLSPWAYVASPLSGKGRGMLFMPEKDDEVLVCFGEGDFSHPYIVGFLWNGVQTSPETEAHNRVIVTPGGHQLRFEDKENDTRILLKSKGNHSILLEDKTGQQKVDIKSNGNREVLLDDNPAGGKVKIVSGQHEILMDDMAGSAKIEIKAGSGVVKITMNVSPPSMDILVGGNTINIASSGMTVTAAGTLTVNTGGTATVNAGGAITVSAAGAATVNATGAITATAGGAATITAGGAASITAAGACSVTATAFSVNAAIATFSGVVQATSLISTAVVGSVYTPSAGNLT